MIVITEINNELTIANLAYLELIKEYITQSRLGNNVIEIFTKLNILKVCRNSLKTYDITSPQITEIEFEHIKDLIYGINGWLFSLSRSTMLSDGSSSSAISSSSTSTITYTGVNVDWIYYKFSATYNNQVVFTDLPFSITEVDPEAIRFIINGEIMVYGSISDYTIVGNILYWNNSLLNIDTQDKLTLAYYLT